jgi:hypothetical protein
VLLAVAHEALKAGPQFVGAQIGRHRT